MIKKKLSIVIPVYDEEATVKEILEKVVTVNLPWEKEIIIVNDASNDNTGRIVSAFVKNHPEIKYFKHDLNKGKGAAVMTGITNATGDYVVIQDADLEYNPEDLIRMTDLVGKKSGVVVYGSRLTQSPVLFGKNKTPILLHYFGNKLLSLITSLLYGAWLTDMETCYKMFPKNALDKFKIKARGFEFEPEITAKLLKNGYKIKEIPITTKPREFSEGKKLNTWRDGKKALFALLKYRLFN